MRFEAEGLSVLHLGDLGHELSEDTYTKLKGCDILLIPIGGTYTIDADSAREIAHRIEPKVIIPMHYRVKCPQKDIQYFKVKTVQATERAC